MAASAVTAVSHGTQRVCLSSKMASSMTAFPGRAGACACLAFALCLLSPRADAQSQPDGVAALLRRIEQAALAGDRSAVLALGLPEISRPSFDDFANTLVSP